MAGGRVRGGIRRGSGLQNRLHDGCEQCWSASDDPLTVGDI